MTMERIILPLDGSDLSEASIPLAETIARAQEAVVIGVRIVPPLTWYTAGTEGYTDPVAYDELLTTIRNVADEYLASTTERIRNAGVRFTTRTLEGPPASLLLDLEEEIKPDLVVMATHGRTGLSRFALGSVSDRLVREGTAPVLLARSFGPEATRLETALVPLDGSEVAEDALPLVEELAVKPLRAVRLLQAISAPDEQPAATEYLQRVANRLSPLSVAVSIDVEVDAPSHAIAQAAENVDVVILATHGRGGFDRLRHGSVAAQATHELTKPLLLVRAGTAR